MNRTGPLTLTLSPAGRGNCADHRRGATIPATRPPRALPLPSAERAGVRGPRADEGARRWKR